MSSASKSKVPRYSVVIVTYNSRDNIQVCLDSLRRCSGGGDHEYIVVDNASRDGTPDYLAKQEDAIALLEKENHGFSKGCNLGAAKAKGEFLVFLNPDTLVTKGWTGAMAQYFEDPGVGAVGPLSNYVAGLQRVDLHLPAPYDKGQEIPGDGAVGKSATVAKLVRKHNAGRGITTKLLIGFCLMMRRDRYEAMGGMDEDLFLGNDDLDLSWRLRNDGLKLVVATDSFVFHEGQKSFKTEAKSHVDRLTQESTDAMYRKLVRHYGARDKVPPPQELWGMAWFTPSPELLRGDPIPMKAEARMATSETRPITAWKGVSLLIHLGPGQGSEVERLDRTLATLPPNAADVVLLNCSGWSGALPRPVEGLRRLDLGAACAPRAALELATALVQDHILFAEAGVGFTALFNHWLDKRAGSLPTALPLPIRPEGLPEASGADFPGCAFLCRKTWLREALGGITISLSNGDPAADVSAFLADLGDRVARSAAAATDKPSDPPWLQARASDLPASPHGVLGPTGLAGGKASPAPAQATAPAAAPSGSWTPVRDSAPAASAGKWDAVINGFPDVLAGPMRGADDIGFAGSVADVLPVKGPFRVFDMKDERVPFENQDLVILRLTPDLIEALPERLANLRRRGKSLKRLLTVINPAQALKKTAPEGSHLAPIDVTPEGTRAALWQAGFAVIGEKPYSGFPRVQGADGDLAGWTLIEAKPRSLEHDLSKKVSIVILGFNQVEYTRKCVDSIRKYTRQDYELILVDNGSKDGTLEFFRGVPGAKVIHNDVNQGVSKGWNQGMRLADGDYILIFNNDTIVGPDWLENMVRLCASDPSIGMVGPRSNYIAGPQIVNRVPYKDEVGIQDFIGKWQAEHELSAAEFGFIKGFCLLIPRPVFDKVGFFDERFGKGNFEDDDYCLRVRYHGYRTLFAHDSFIHHYGSVSFNQESVDWKALMVENQQKYVKKWSQGAAAVHDTVVSDPGPAVQEAMDAAAAAAAKAGAISIPGLEEVTAQLMSLPGFEGYSGKSSPSARTSSDAGAAWTPTPDRASVKRPAPQEVEDAKRAYAAGEIERARGLFLDAQNRAPDHAEPICGLGVLAFHDGNHLDAGKLFMRCLEMDPVHEDAARNLIDVLEILEDGVPPGDVATLVQRYPANPVLRQLLEEIDAANASAAADSWRAEIEDWIGRRHFAPAIDALETRVKSGRDMAACYNYMGVIAHSCGDLAFAADNFRLSLRTDGAQADTVYNLADILIATGRPQDALTLLEAPPKLAPGEAECAEFEAAAEQLAASLELGHVDAGRLSRSREVNQSAEASLRANRAVEAAALLESHLTGEPRDFRALNNLGLARWYLGDAAAAWNAFHAGLDLRPAWTDALVNGFDAALSAGRMDEFEPVLDRALATRPDHPEGRRMARHIDREGAAIHVCGNFGELEADAEILSKGDKAMEEGRKSDAINAFLLAMERRPSNPQALNGLGIVAFAEERHVDAYALFDAAAALNPMDQDILVNLWQAARALRREEDVLPRLKNSVERNPAFHDVKAILANA